LCAAETAESENTRQERNGRTYVFQPRTTACFAKEPPCCGITTPSIKGPKAPGSDGFVLTARQAQCQNETANTALNLNCVGDALAPAAPLHLAGLVDEEHERAPQKINQHQAKAKVTGQHSDWLHAQCYQSARNANALHHKSILHRSSHAAFLSTKRSPEESQSGLQSGQAQERR